MPRFLNTFFWVYKHYKRAEAIKKILSIISDNSIKGIVHSKKENSVIIY